MSEFTDDFTGIIDELTEYRLGITKIINNVKQLDKKISKTIQKHNTNIVTKVQKKPSGFAIPTQISKELSIFMNKMLIHIFLNCKISYRISTTI